MTFPSSWSKMGTMKEAVLLLTTLVHLSTAQSKLRILCSGCVYVCAQYTAINVYNLYIHRVACPEITVHSRALLAELSPAWLLFRSMYICDWTSLLHRLYMHMWHVLHVALWYLRVSSPTNHAFKNSHSLTLGRMLYFRSPFGTFEFDRRTLQNERRVT